MIKDIISKQQTMLKKKKVYKEQPLVDFRKSVTQAEFFRHFTKADRHGFLEDISAQIIDRVLGYSRQREG